MQALVVSQSARPPSSRRLAACARAEAPKWPAEPPSLKRSYTEASGMSTERVRVAARLLRPGVLASRFPDGYRVAMEHGNNRSTLRFDWKIPARFKRRKSRGRQICTCRVPSTCHGHKATDTWSVLGPNCRYFANKNKQLMS